MFFPWSVLCPICKRGKCEALATLLGRAKGMVRDRETENWDEADGSI